MDTFILADIAWSLTSVLHICRPQWSWKELKGHGTSWNKENVISLCFIYNSSAVPATHTRGKNYKCYFFLQSKHLEGECKADFMSLRQCYCQTWAVPCAFHTLLLTVHQCHLPLRSTNVLHQPNVHFRHFIWIQVKDLNTSKNAVRMEHETAKHS